MFIICQIYRFPLLCFGPWDGCCEMKQVAKCDGNDDIHWLILFQILLTVNPDVQSLKKTHLLILKSIMKYNKVKLVTLTIKYMKYIYIL